LADALSTGIVS